MEGCAHLPSHVVDALPPIGGLPLAHALQAARAVRGDAWADRLQREVPHEPVLVYVHEHGRAPVEVYLIRGHPTGHLILILHSMVQRRHGAGDPLCVVAGGVLDCAGHAVAPAEAALRARRAFANSFGKAHASEPAGTSTLAEANLRPGILVLVARHRDQPAVGWVDLHDVCADQTGAGEESAQSAGDRQVRVIRSEWAVADAACRRSGAVPSHARVL